MMEEVSASLADLYENIGGPDEHPQGTYDSVLQAIRDKIVSMSDDDEVIRLNQRVLKIEYNPKLDDQNDKHGVTITVEQQTATGNEQSEIECDYCVCTVPLGVLKQNKIEFVPPFSPARIQAIDAIGMGLLDKIIMKFDTCFWGDLKQFGIGHDDPSRVRQFYDYSFEVGAEAVLIHFLAGEAARRIDAVDQNGNPIPSLSDEEAVEESLEALRLLFGHDNVPRPKAFKVTRWRQDPFAFGSYTFARVGSTIDMYDEIAKPLGNLFFAGEHTSKHGHSTVHGAWGTGTREANRIHRMLDSTTPRRFR
jgi:monoamine oxidase